MELKYLVNKKGWGSIYRNLPQTSKIPLYNIYPFFPHKAKTTVWLSLGKM